MSNLSITGPKVYTSEGVLKNAIVQVEAGIITSIETHVSRRPASLSFPSNFHLVPGFIDLHVHGLYGADVMDGLPDSLTTISRGLLAEGTTGFLATTMTESSDKIAKALSNIQVFRANPMEDAECLGVHLEGPFIAPSKAGAQHPKHILSPDVTLFQHWQTLSGQAIRAVTLAPEIQGALTFIKFLLAENIIPALGHSEATYAEGLQAIQCGAHYVTHLFNAMRNLHQREPGMVSAALLNEGVFTEIIVDGIHLHPAIVDLVYRLKKDKIILMTDAMRAKCCNDGVYEFGGQVVHLKAGIARLENGALAGSTLRMPDAIRNFQRMTQCPLEVAIKMATENPAKVLGIFTRKGSISVGKEADLVVLNENFEVVMTLCKGTIRFKNYEPAMH